MSADTSVPPRRIPLSRLFASWCLYTGMRFVVLFPLEWQIAFGKRVGLLLRMILRRRRRVVDKNLSACFPDLPDDEITALGRRHFEAFGASLAERAMGWFGPIERIRRAVTVNGEEHLRAALESGRGAVLMTVHFTTMEIFYPIIRELAPYTCAMYKRLKNPAMDRVILGARHRSFDVLFPKDNLREMIACLRRNGTVWYASDQSFTHKSGALIPFFGEPAMTNTAISRIAKSTGATVLPLLCRRRADDSGYEMTILPPLAGFPSDDVVADAQRFVSIFEDFIRTCPEQYWWVHQRFKGRPAGYADLYEQ